MQWEFSGLQDGRRLEYHEAFDGMCNGAGKKGAGGSAVAKRNFEGRPDDVAGTLWATEGALWSHVMLVLNEVYRTH